MLRASVSVAVVEQTLDVVFALIADESDPFLRSASEEEWDRPYSERRTVKLKVAPDDRLQDVLASIRQQARRVAR